MFLIKIIGTRNTISTMSAAVFLKSAKIERNYGALLSVNIRWHCIHCNLSNRSFDCGEETSKCRHFAFSVQYFSYTCICTCWWWTYEVGLELKFNELSISKRFSKLLMERSCHNMVWQWIPQTNNSSLWEEIFSGVETTRFLVGFNVQVNSISPLPVILYTPV